MTDQEKIDEAKPRHYGIPEKELEIEFDDLARLASQVCQTPVGVITLGDHDWLWFSSTLWSGAAELPLGFPECRETLNQQDDLLIIEDVFTDARFDSAGKFPDAPAIRFFAGVPLITSDALRIGMLCVLDVKPGTLTQIQIETFVMLADRVIASLELQLSRRSFRNTLETIKDGLVTLDETFHILHINQRASSLFNIPTDKAIGRSFHELFDFPADEILLDLIQRTAETGTAGMVEFPCARTGSLLQVESARSPDGFTLLTRDISGERRNEEQLRVLWTCISRLNDIVLITEADPIVEPGPLIIYANDAFVSRTGYSREEVLGRSPRFLQGPATQRDALDRIRAAMESRSPSREELINYTKSGEAFWLELEIAPVSDEQGRLTHFVSVERDITERKKLELEHQKTLIHLNERLKELRALHETSRLLRDGVIDPATLLAKTAANLRDAFRNPESTAVRLVYGAHSFESESFRESNWMFSSGFEDTLGVPGRLTAVHLGDTDEDPFLPEEREMLDSISEMLLSHFSRQQTKIALRDSEERLARSQKIARLGTWEMNIGTGQLHWSEETLSIFGFDLKAGDPSYEEYLATIHPEDRPGLQAVAGSTIAGGGRFELDHRIVRPDGEVRWVHGIGELRSSFGEGGDFLVGTVLDITERKRTEERLRESEERLRCLSRATNDAIWEWNIPADEVVWNEGYDTLFGRTGITVGKSLKSWSDFIHPDDLDRATTTLFTMIESGGDYWEGEYRFRHADGNYLYVHDRGRVMRNSRGEPVRMIGGMTDLTESKKAEAKLQEQATLLEKAKDAILVRDLEHNILFWNRGAELLYGWTAEEAIGCSVARLLYSSIEQFEEATRTVIEKGDWSGEVEQFDKEGRRKTVEGSWTLMRDAEGNPKSILSINTDLTDRRELERQFLRTQRLESLGTLAGGIAHDLNNVLTPILMSIELLTSKETDPGRLQLLSAIDSSAKRGADMVKQVLAFGRGVEGQLSGTNLGLLVEEVIKIVRDTFPPNIIVGFEREEPLWTILGDSTQLHQVLLNLAVNARDSMPQGGALSFAVENREIEETYADTKEGIKAGRYVALHVDDTGTGMSKEVLDRIFEPFFTTKDIGKGTGLGLSTSLAIVKSHGGHMQAFSEPGRGTRFLLHFPASDHISESVEPAGELEYLRGKGETILLVEDEAVVRDITRQTLITFGYRVIPASDGAEAVAIYAKERHRIDLVLTDMMMPVMDGPSTIQVLQKIAPDVRIIAASGLNSDAMVAKAANLGVSNFIPKPYTAEILLKTLFRVINETGSEE